MREYLFLDGPLEGQLILSPDRHVEGDLFAVEIVDIDELPEDIRSFSYTVEARAGDDEPGLLRHTGQAPAPVDDDGRSAAA